MKNYIKVIMFIVFVSSISFSQKQLSLNLNQSINLGLKNNPALHGSKMSVTIAEAKFSEAKTYKLPTLQFGASYSRLSEIDPFIVETPFGEFDISPTFFDIYNLKISLQQPVFTGFKLESTSEIAEYNSLASKQDYSKAEKDLIYNIKNAYWSLYKSIKIKKVVDENVRQINSHLTDVNNLFDQGLATKNDVLKVQVQLAEATLRQIESQNGVEIANVFLNNLIGIELTAEVNITEILKKERAEIENLEILLESAYKNRADLKSMNFRVSASEASIKLAKSDLLPQIYISGNYYYSNPNQRILPTVDKFKGTWDLSVSLSFNLWDWGATRDKTTQAKMQYQQAKDYYSSLKDAIKLDVTSSYLNVKKTTQMMLVAEKSVTEAEENYRVTNDKFKNGLVSNSELLDAEVALLQAKTNDIYAIVDNKLSVASLNKAVGN